MGQMLATIVVQGGERPCLFSQSVCDYICMGLDKTNPSIDEVPDFKVREDLKKVLYLIS